MHKTDHSVWKLPKLVPKIVLLLLCVKESERIPKVGSCTSLCAVLNQSSYICMTLNFQGIALSSKLGLAFCLSADPEKLKTHFNFNLLF